ncbi:hypothetical protein HRD49_03690 [Corallococcus exiguus]|uniref:hypothetical protein n=1 Tax=Corallococcus exiguus TaxID=83462 RepID=UPI00155F8097|nr:hypothetical protein [Corallococcus exiguus]NRD60842.1 hypothetical protein [Corallococcus exiguus]
MRLSTWHLEAAVVYAILIAVNLFTHADALEWLGALAVALGFHHASVASRMAEAEAARPVPSVECFRMAALYFVGKEVAWFAYFAAKGSYSALVGCAVFAVHPLWRRWYRARFPKVVTS